MMSQKPTYEDLQQRILELEKAESERKRVEQALRGREEHIHSIFRSAPIGIGLVVNREIRQVNSRLCEITGYNAEELIGQSSRILYPSNEDFEFVGREKYTQIRAYGTGTVETHWQQKDGTIIDVLLSSTPLDLQDYSKGVTFTALDITKRKRAEEYLKYFQKIISSTQDGIALLDTNYRYVIVNRAYETFSGITEEHFIGRTIAEYFGEDIFESIVKRNIDRCLQGEMIRYQEWFDYPTLGRRWVELTYYPYRDEHDQIVGIVSNTRDITEQHQAQMALVQSEKKYRELFESNQDAITIFRIDPDRTAGYFLDMNQAALTLGGYSKEEFYNLKPQDFEKEASAETIDTRLAEVESKGNAHFETVLFNRDGEKIPVEIQVRQIQYEGRPAIMNIARDIRNRKHVENALRESEERFRLTFYTSPDAVNINKMDGTYLDINEGFTQLTGYTRKDTLGKTSSDINIWDIPEDRKRLVAMLQKNGYVRNLESRFRTKNGSCKIALMSAAIIQLQGEPHILSITRDITNFRKAEEDKLILERQLQQAQKMESVGRLAGGVAHDFNNMLSVILGHAEMAMEQLDASHPIVDHLQQIQHAADRSSDITRQLLAFARKQIVAPSVIDLNETIAGTLKMLLRLIGEHIDLAWRPGNRVWPIKIDPSQIDQILTNLCVNARDAIAGVGNITVATGNCTLDEEYCAIHAGFIVGEYVKIEVSDNGSGIDKETMSHIFEPFFTTKDVNEGTGLGLATVYGIVKQNNGFVNVYSEQGQGTTFMVYLPRHVGTTDTEVVDSTDAPDPGGNETILLVEDEPTILDMTKRMLTRLGYTVLAASTPSKAIDLSGEYMGEIHLLLTDVIMPEMNGRILSQKLMANRPDLHCLFMSGYSANIISRQSVLEDGVHFIQKPFTKKELAAKLRRILNSR